MNPGSARGFISTEDAENAGVRRRDATRMTLGAVEDNYFLRNQANWRMLPELGVGKRRGEDINGRPTISESSRADACSQVLFLS